LSLKIDEQTYESFYSIISTHKPGYVPLVIKGGTHQTCSLSQAANRDVKFVPVTANHYESWDNNHL